MSVPLSATHSPQWREKLTYLVKQFHHLPAEQWPDLAREIDTQFQPIRVNLLPNTPDTHDVYDAELFAQFNPNAVFINAGRAGRGLEWVLYAHWVVESLACAIIKDLTLCLLIWALLCKPHVHYGVDRE